MRNEVKLEKQGYHKIVVGTDLDVPTVVIWFESRNKVVDSDIKSETFAVALGELVQRELQTYVDLNEEMSSHEENNNPDRFKTVRES